jgi:hypothetical protein
MRTSLREQVAVVPGGYARQESIGNNTRKFVYADGTIRIVLHQTVIVTIDPDGNYTMNSGGYWSRTTLDRLNDHCPPGWSIRQQGGKWFARHVRDMPGTVRPFFDGIVLGSLTQSH